MKIKLLLPILLLTGLSLACALPALGKPGTSSTAVPSADQPFSAPGSFNLTDGNMGLAGLDSYQAVLTTTFNGTRGGQAYQFSSTLTNQMQTKTLEMLASLNSVDSDNQPIVLTSGEILGMSILQTGSDQPCQAISSDLMTEAPSMPGAAAQLPKVTGAEKVGDETINGVSAVHYRFDQRSLPDYPDGITASGNLWIASQGGWVVKYQLTISAGENILGAKLAGEQTWQYDLTPNTTSMPLPSSCAALPFFFPRAGDASQVSLMPGYIEYLSASPVNTMTEFYITRLSDHGWVPLNSAAPAEDMNPSMLVFKKTENQDVSFAWLDIQPSGEGTRIEVLLASADIQTAVQEIPETPAAQPTLDLSTSGLPAGVPIYPGAHDVTGMADKLVMYQVDVPPADVETFYRDQLQADGWQLLAETAGSQWQKDGIMLNIQTQSNESGTQVILVWITMP